MEVENVGRVREVLTQEVAGAPRDGASPTRSTPAGARRVVDLPLG